MKVELEMFQNYASYREYAVRFKKHWYSKWEYTKNDKGNNALYKFEDACKMKEKLKSE